MSGAIPIRCDRSRGGVNLLAAWYLADPKKNRGPRKNIPQPSGGGDRKRGFRSMSFRASGW